MAKNKTEATTESVNEFVEQVDDPIKRADSYALIKLFSEIIGCEAKLWGPSIIGFGTYHYKYKSGHEGNAPLAAFSPRKPAIVLYFASDLEDREQLLSALGKHTSSKACVYIKQLADIDQQILIKMTHNSIATVALDNSGHC